ncbi:hypothetical protein N658DRAFT_432105 [Parathielavia hyrcaniae]|uniref:LisH domain-containing protein n=1 Tax=Parathielavia hyrcaniae TaxID=113614 RepID=A0AAN6SYS3_9PEZI|nr:hypothetical protein N658DRAFT_432105 [Parathielavia hyrcaniae]
MNNVPGIPNMNPMAGPVGPVGPPMNVMNNGAMGGPQPSAPGQIQMNDSSRTLLNTYIYEYFIRYNMFAAARGVLEADPQIRVMKESPGKMRDENGNLLGNGLGDSMDTDSKDGLDHKRPDDLPAPNVPTPLPDSCFLYEWFCLFWDMFNSQKGKGSSGQVNQYVHHTQVRSPAAPPPIRQQQQRDLLRQMRPDHLAQQQYHQQLIARGMPNGGMHMGMKPGNHLPRAAIANSQNPQAMQMLQNKAAGQMQRDPADMDGNRVRPADGEADNAPSPKRPRLEGGAPFNPNQPVMINGRPGQGMPGQPQVGGAPDYVFAQTLLRQHGINPTWLNPDQLQAFASAPPQMQAKIASYSANLSQHHGNQMPNKPLPNAGGPQNQGSPMVPQGPDGNSLTQYYNPGDLGPANMRPGGPNGQGAAGSNHALQDYQMQLMLLEQQNKKRLMMARQEQDLTTTGNTPRMDGPGGPGAPPGPNAQGIQGTSPPGGRSGASPNPSEQMRRTNQQQMANAANMGSPLPDGAQSRGSPGAMNFMGGNMDPNAGPHFMNMNMASQMNGGMRPPSSHPPFNGHMSQQQLMARQQAAAAAQGAPMQWQGGPNGQMPGQPPQPQVPGGPAPNQRSMPPPPSAPATAVAAANARNATASPQVSNAAPPTPQQATKAAPKKKETKSAKAKAAAQKKNNANLNNAAATPAPEPTEAPQEGPTPATPMTPVNAANFAKNQGVNAGQVVPNGQPPAPAPQQQAPPVPPPTHTDPNQNTSFLDPGAMVSLDCFPRVAADNVLDGFDFDSFLQDGTNGEEGPFDFNTGFSMEPDTTIGATE